MRVPPVLLHRRSSPAKPESYRHSGNIVSSIAASVSKPTSAPADAIDRTATIHRCPTPYSNTRSTDADGRGSRNRPGPEHDTRPGDAIGGIAYVRTIHHGIGLLGACGYEPSYQ